MPSTDLFTNSIEPASNIPPVYTTPLIAVQHYHPQRRTAPEDLARCERRIQHAIVASSPHSTHEISFPPLYSYIILSSNRIYDCFSLASPLFLGIERAFGGSHPLLHQLKALSNSRRDPHSISKVLSKSVQSHRASFEAPQSTLKVAQAALGASI